VLPSSGAGEALDAVRRHILSKQTLPFRDRELLILPHRWLNEAEYEFAQHELIAKKAASPTPTSSV